MLVSFLCFFFLINLFNYHTFMTRLCSQTHIHPHPKLLSLVLQLDPLKLGSCKFNIIINIINITLGSGVVAKPKILGYNFVERPNTFRSWLFLIFFMQKKLTCGNARVMQLVFWYEPSV